ncbi:MAG: hypothetical protein EBQ92_11795 [Proteobacteria bacterium]|nr:hypothetical protein [Pseudomonadota bacterium]
MNGLLIILMLGFFLSTSVQAGCSNGICEVAGKEEEESENEPRPYNIPLPGGGSYQATEKEYQQWVAQQQQLQRRQQMQQQLQSQLQNLMGGSGGSGSGGGGGGGGGGSGSGGQSSGNSNSIKPLEASAFGQIPNYSSNPAQKALEELVGQSGKPDSESQQFLDEIKKQIEESAKRPELPQLNTKLSTGLNDINRLIMETLAAIQAMPPTLSGSDQLLRNASIIKKRRTVGRPMEVPRDRGIVVGQSYSTMVGGRGLASLAGGTIARVPETEIEPPKKNRTLRSSHRRR